MTNRERRREIVAAPPTLEHLAEQMATGWRMTAIEWERESAGAANQPAAPLAEDIPYGLRVADDCRGLVEDAGERQVVIAALDMIVDDQPLSRVAEELNQRGYRTRDGRDWTPTALFVLLPRMIAIGPRLFTSSDWSERKQRLRRVV